LIVLENVTYIYPHSDTPAVCQVSLEIAPCERVAVIGPSGSGKSTLGRLIAGLLRPVTGRITWNGAEPGAGARGREVAIVFQNPETQLVAATVEEDVALGPENLGLPSDEIRRRVQSALEALDIVHLAKRPVAALSGGEKQRVAIAGALAMAPACLVLDEASTMLHPLAKRQLEEALSRIRGSVAIVQITHDMDEAARADRVVLLHRGRLIASGPPEEILTDDTLLEESGLVPPEPVQLAASLRSRGFDFAKIPLDASLLADAVAKAVAP